MWQDWSGHWAGKLRAMCRHAIFLAWRSDSSRSFETTHIYAQFVGVCLRQICLGESTQIDYCQHLFEEPKRLDAEAAGERTYWRFGLHFVIFANKHGCCSHKKLK